MKDMTTPVMQRTARKFVTLAENKLGLRDPILPPVGGTNAD